ncbi:MAG TPA: hypothetical protein VKV04_07725, partial [Verrucomicrobiae bacterium]|nr:hypothetical protein [Verrucomicrobiae bacterium]
SASTALWASNHLWTLKNSSIKSKPITISRVLTGLSKKDHFLVLALEFAASTLLARLSSAKAA